MNNIYQKMIFNDNTIINHTEYENGKTKIKKNDN